MPGWKHGRAWSPCHRTVGGVFVTDEEMPSARSSARREGHVEGAKRTRGGLGPCSGPRQPQGKASAQTVGEDGNPGQGGEGLRDLLTEMGQGRGGFA